MQIPLWTNKKILEGGEPFLLEGKPFDSAQGKQKIGILLIHGWSSTPQELRNTATYLNSLGYPVYAPLLRGHGTEARDLIGLKWEDWLEDIYSAYDWFSKHVDEIVVGGMSTGSLLALNLSLKRKVKGIIAMGTPVFVKLRWKILLRVVAWIFRDRKLFKKIYRKDDWEVAKKKIHYFEFPPRSMWEVFRSISATRKIIPKITEPILVMQSGSDKIILPKSAEYVYANVASKTKRLVFFADSYHVFTVDKEAAKAHKIMGDFINKIARFS